MTADADAVIIPGAERSRCEPWPSSLARSLAHWARAWLGLCPGARMHLITSKNTKLQLTSLTGRAILSYCSEPSRESVAATFFLVGPARTCLQQPSSFVAHTRWLTLARLDRAQGWIGEPAGNQASVDASETPRPDPRT